MSIQQAINQGIGVASAIYTQTGAYKEKQERKALVQEQEALRKGARAMTAAGIDPQSAIFQRQRELYKENIASRLRHGLISDPEKIKQAEKYFEPKKEDNEVNTLREEREEYLGRLGEYEEAATMMNDELKAVKANFKALQEQVAKSKQKDLIITNINKWGSL